MAFMSSFCFISLAISMLQLCSSLQLPDLYWNSSNPIFNSVIEPHHISVWMKDRLDIHCPYYQPGVPNADFVEYSAIYQVSEWGFENCILDESARILITCQTPFQPTRPLSITFRKWTPNPWAPEFQPGKMYYFITTSGGTEDSVRQSAGGLCSSSGMRMKVEVNGYRPRKPQSPSAFNRNIPTTTSQPSPIVDTKHLSPKFKLSSTNVKPISAVKRPSPSYEKFEVIDPPIPGVTLPPPNHIQKGQYNYQADQRTRTHLPAKFGAAKIPEISTSNNRGRPQELNPLRRIFSRPYRPSPPSWMPQRHLAYDLGAKMFADEAQPMHADGLDQIEVLVEYAAAPQNSAPSLSNFETILPSLLIITMIVTLTL